MSTKHTETPGGADSASYGVTATINHPVNDGDTLVLNTERNDEGTYDVSEGADALRHKDDEAVFETRYEAQAYIEEMTRKIKNSLADQRASIFETCDLLREANSKLHSKDFSKIWHAIGFASWTNVENYIRIAKCTHLRKPEYQPYLPVSVGALSQRSFSFSAFNFACKFRLEKPD